ALARGGEFALGLLQRLVGFAKARLAFRQTVGRLLAPALGVGDLLAKRQALGLDLGGLGGKLGDRARDLLTPCVKLDDLALGVGLPLAPAGMILRGLIEPLGPPRPFPPPADALGFPFHPPHPAP